MDNQYFLKKQVKKLSTILGLTVFLIFVLFIIYSLDFSSGGLKKNNSIVNDFVLYQLPGVSDKTVSWVKVYDVESINYKKYLLEVPGNATNINVSLSTKEKTLANRVFSFASNNTDRKEFSKQSTIFSRSPASLELQKSIKRKTGFFERFLNLFSSRLPHMFAAVDSSDSSSTILIDMNASTSSTGGDILITTQDGASPSFVEIPTEVVDVLHEEINKIEVSTTTPEATSTFVSPTGENHSADSVIAVEYKTPAPTIAEAETETGKVVTISAPDAEVPVTNVLAYTNIPEIYKVGQEDKIKIKWTNNNDKDVIFKAYDLNGNGKLDYVEWTVPHLSTQTFEIIFISKAFQLDANKEILADIYEETNVKDNIFASIHDGQYVRATFQQSLTKKNDISIFARPIYSNESASIEVYPVYTDSDGNMTEGPLVATFSNINHEGNYKILLTNLDNRTDVFDLKVIGNINFDYIVDPVCAEAPDDALYTVCTYTANDTFTAPAGVSSVEVLVVAGGGGGGFGFSGGGGAGGLIYEAFHSVTTQAYPITIGLGGAGSTVPSDDGTNGGDSTFDTLTAIGGGGGGSFGSNYDGSNGGSGGGSGNSTGFVNNGGTGVVGQGNNGGNSSGAEAPSYGAGGGGGSSGAGENGTATKGGDGGAGTASSISGTSLYYAGGGGGGSRNGSISLGGSGVGGNGSIDTTTTGQSGAPNTGSGGGGAGDDGIGGYGIGGAGSDGIVIIRYLTPTSSWACGDTLTDTRDSKIYNTVAIGTQCWFAQNINVGTMTSGSGDQGTSCSSIQKYCYNDDENICTTDGGLYQWDQAMCGSPSGEGVQGICPTGWHVPSDTDWYTLENYLTDNGQTCDPNRFGWDCTSAGTKLLSGGSSGFNDILAGHRQDVDLFVNRSIAAYYWSSIDNPGDGYAWERLLQPDRAEVLRVDSPKYYGFPVRCLNDNTITPATVPDAPTSVFATAGNAQTEVTFTPGADGGSSIIYYTVTSNPNNIIATGTSSPVTVTGLTNGTPYTFTVTATNAIGTSTPSSASNEVTPSAGGGGGGTYEIPQNGLVSYWKFDDASGSTVVDSSGNGNSGNIINSPIWTTGKVGGALNLDGSNDAVIGTNNLGITNEVTYSYWLKKDQPASYQKFILSSVGSLGDRVNIIGFNGEGYPSSSGSKIGMRTGILGSDWPGGNNTESTSDVTDGTWHHIVFTRNGQTAQTYVDGALENEVTGYDSTPITNLPMLIGAYTTDGGSSYIDWFNISMAIDELAVYNRVLSASEILDIYNGQNGTPISTVTVSSVDPTSGTNNNPVMLNGVSNAITGTGFVTGAEVKLTKAGQTDIVCTGTTVVSPTEIRGGACDITNTATGTWNVVVTNTDTGSGTLTNGFTVNASSGGGGTYEIPQNGLVGYWKFDEGSGTTAVDSSTSGNNGILVNSSTWILGKINQALDFSSLGGVQVLDSSSLQTNTITIAQWVNPSVGVYSQPGSRSYILDKEGSYALWFNNHASTGCGPCGCPDGQLWFDLWDWNGVATQDTTIWNPNEWYYVVSTYDGNTAKIYVNGVENNSCSFSKSLGTSGDLYINSNNDSNSGNYFNGKIDETSIYNRALSAQEVLDIYNGQNSGGGGSTSTPFISTWDTTKGNNDNTITLPISGTYTVDWGDGTINSDTPTHDYGVATSSVTIKITGTGGGITGWSFNNSGDKDKIKDISQWGDLRLGNSGNYFYGAENLKITATDILNLTGVVNMSWAFANSGIDTVPSMNDWDVSNVTDMSYMFLGASQFNQNIGNWNVSNVVAMASMFYSAASFNNGGISTISNWDTSNVVYMAQMFDFASSFNQPINTSGNHWNVSKITNMGYMFHGASSFNQDIGNWNLSSTTNISYMFGGATAFNNGGSSSINNWNVSNVTTMQGTFNNASAFNQDISGWDVSKVTIMYDMFNGASLFNQDIGQWGTKTGNVTNMGAMFEYTSSFNQDLGSWDVSNVVYMSGMFLSSSFNNAGTSTINNWNVSSVTDMSYMFYSASSFNQDIGSWNVGSVTNMMAMFQDASSFNNNATSTINNWNTSNVTNMRFMFYSTPFNQDIGSWNVSNVLYMDHMFDGASLFNQPINTSGSYWDVSHVTNMSYMFLNASSFDQDLGSWNVSNVELMYQMFSGVTLSTTNYSNLLLGWSTRILQHNVPFDAGSSKYYTGAAETARGVLAGTYGWNITDGGSEAGGGGGTTANLPWVLDTDGVSKLYIYPEDSSIQSGNPYYTTWGCDGTVTGGQSNTDGSANTTAIMLAGCAGVDTAAKICSDLDFGGYTDWYLPAKDQFNAMYTQRGSVNTDNYSGTPAWTNLWDMESYWTSTEVSANEVWDVSVMGGGTNFPFGKSNIQHSRCVRSGNGGGSGGTYEIPQNGLVGYWKFDEGSGDTAIDSSTNGYTGTWTGSGIHYSTAKVGSYSAQFNGNDDYINLPFNASVFTDQFTVSGWVNSNWNTQCGEVQGIFDADPSSSRNMGMGICNQSGNEVWFGFFNTLGQQFMVGSRDIASIGFDEWHYVTAKYDGSTLSLYIDANFVASIPANGNVVDNNVNFQIGHSQNDDMPYRYFRGLIDEFVVYNRALSAGEISAIYTGQGGTPISTVTVISIDPMSGTNDGTVFLNTITGTGFVDGAVVKLTKPIEGQPDIICSATTVASPTEITGGACDLTGALVGAWNVVVTNPDTGTGSLDFTFTVSQGGGGGGTTANLPWVLDTDGVSKLYIYPEDSSIQSGNPYYLSWGCDGTDTGALSNTDGSANTTAIMSAGCAGVDTVAKICSDLDFGGYTDWYLPAIDQLSTMYTQRGSVNTDNYSGIPAWTNLSDMESYWSSTESSGSDVWLITFMGGGNTYTYSKGHIAHSRCVRSGGGTPISTPTVTSIDPTSGTSTGPVFLNTITGTGFIDGATVKLTKPYESDIFCSAITVASPTEITGGECDLTNVATGTWAVLVTNPDTGYGILNDSFTVTTSSGGGGEIGSNFVLSDANYNKVIKFDGDGNMVWENSPGDNRHSIVNPVDGSVLTPLVWDGGLIKYDISGNILWSIPVPGSHGIELNPVDGSVLLSVYSVNGNVMKIDRDGNTIWDKDLGISFAYGLPIDPHDGSFALAQGNNLLKFDTDGNPLWNINTGYEIYDAPAIDYNDGSLVIVTVGGHVLKFDKFGNQLWDISLPTSYTTGVSINYHDGSIAVGDVDNNITKLDRNGNVLWSHLIDGLPQYNMRGAVDPFDGSIIVTNPEGGRIIKFDSNGNLLWDKNIGASFISLISVEDKSFNVSDYQTISTPTVTSIDPTEGANDNPAMLNGVSNAITGTGFVTGAEVKLTKAGQTDIVCTGTTVVSSTEIVGGACDITGALVGAWNVVVTNPDTGTGSLDFAFTVTQGGGGGGTTVNIGDIYEGGTVFYILQPGDIGYDSNIQRGLIAASVDQASSTSLNWGCTWKDLPGADATAIGTGQQNTFDIVSGCTDTGIAAKVANSYNGGGYSDWYLPSKGELNLMFLASTTIGNLAPSKYWTSSEVSSSSAWRQGMGGGTQDTFYKYSNTSTTTTVYYVRAIRTFGTSTIATAPDAPASVTAVAGDGKAKVTITPSASNGGSVIINYTITSSPDNISVSTTSNPVFITGLTNNTVYTFNVTATNAIGTGASTVSNSVKPLSGLLSVGDEYQGGKIIYILKDGDIGYDSNKQSGLIASIVSQSTGTEWGCSGVTTGATGQNIGTGQQNTQALVSNSCTAAMLTQGDINGYSDWYLPSKEELRQLYINKSIFDNVVATKHWSSSEINSSNAIRVGMGAGYADVTAKTTSVNHVVRAFRSFVTDIPTGGGGSATSFISTWDTTQSGSASDTIVLPISGTYDVDWGDGTVNSNTDTHTYAEATTSVTISITPTGSGITGWSFNNNGDVQKIKEISQWGDLRLGNDGGYFYGTSNLKITATDILDLTGTTNMQFAFAYSGIDTVPSMNSWNVSSVTNMGEVFYYTPLFNQDIGGWDTSSVTNMNEMFEAATSFNQDIGNWNVSNVTSMMYTFFGANSFNNGGTSNINNWNVSSVTNMSNMFNSATSFDQLIGSWNVSNVTNMNNLFANSVFNQDIGNWDVSNVTDMNNMFQNTPFFNQNIGGWDTSSVTNMNNMFGSAVAFNQDIGAWNVSTVNDMQSMFAGSTAFNNGGTGNINNWNVGNVMNMNSMFNSALSFNQNIGGWNTGSVTNMGSMFSGARVFNQDIGNWNTSNVTDMNMMFSGALVFNNGSSGAINNWNVSSVTNMYRMFERASSFNQSIGNWNTGNVTNMNNMFREASAFNQNIGNWNVSNVTNMGQMFRFATSFNQNIGAWDVSNVSIFTQFLTGVTLSTANYSALLQGWSARTLQPANTFNGGNSKYYEGAPATARQYIIDNFGWTITDGGSEVAPITVPYAPIISTVTSGNGEATITFSPPVNDGGSEITGYTVTSSPGDIIGTGVSSPITVSGLTNGTIYTFTVTATNAVGTSSPSSTSNEVMPVAPWVSCGDYLGDARDGKGYSTVLIGSQCWMAQNINIGTTTLGSADQTDNSIIEKYCYGNIPSNCSVYGGLYQWDEAMQYTANEGAEGICPSGWHVPSDNEWMTMEEQLGMCAGTGTGCSGATGWRGTTEGGMLKEVGTVHWNNPNNGATNSSGFTALPGGQRNNTGLFTTMRTNSGFWTSSEYSPTASFRRMLTNINTTILKGTNTVKQSGQSIRCLKNETPISTVTVTSVDPMSGTNDNTVSLNEIIGTGFIDGAVVKLTKEGQTDIACTATTVASPTSITGGACDLTGALVGAWNVVVTNPDTSSGILDHLFTVEIGNVCNPDIQICQNDACNAIFPASFARDDWHYVAGDLSCEAGSLTVSTDSFCDSNGIPEVTHGLCALNLNDLSHYYCVSYTRNGGSAPSCYAPSYNIESTFFAGVTQDTTAPTVSIVAPTDNSTVSGSNVYIEVSASDDVGVVGVRFELYSEDMLDYIGDISTEAITAPYITTGDSTLVPDGIYKGIAVARDQAGNYATSSPVTVTVHNVITPSDTTSPNISLTPLSPDPTTNTTPMIFGTSTDVGGIVTSIEFQMDGTGGAWSACLNTGTNFDTFVCTTPTLSVGTHTIYVRGTDSNANTTANIDAVTDVFTITTVSTPPPPRRNNDNNQGGNNQGQNGQGGTQEQVPYAPDYVPPTETATSTPEVTATSTATSTPEVTASSTLPLGFCFNKNLVPPITDSDVKNLQIFLNDRGFLSTAIGSETEVYGTQTSDAVKSFQEYYAADILTPSNLTVGTGNFGTDTRAKANSLIPGCGTLPETATTTPEHIDALNTDLVILPEQSGTALRDTKVGQVTVEVPVQNIPEETTFKIIEEVLNLTEQNITALKVLAAPEVQFKVIAIKKTGETLTTFPKPLQIVLPIPSSLVGGKNLGVYYKNDATGLWVKVPGATFENGKATFTVNHLTVFTILSTEEEIPEVYNPDFPEELETPSESPITEPTTPGVGEGAITGPTGGGAGSGIVDESEVVSVPTTDSGKAIEQIFSSAPEEIQEAVAQVVVVTEKAVEKTKEAINTPTGSVVTKTVSTVGVVAGAGASVSAVALANPITFSELWLIPAKLFGLLMGALGLRKKYRQWGTVYDAVTKRPLDPVYVSLINLDTGKEVANAITDIDGRYGFLVLPGRYKIEVKKTNYVSPSVIMKGKSFDEVYNDIYLGEEIAVTVEGEIITKNIPMDSLSFDWNEFAKTKMNVNTFMKTKDITVAKVSGYLFGLGAIVSLVALIFAPAPYNFIIAGLYILTYVLNYFVFKAKKAGRLIESVTGRPLSFAIVKIYREGETMPMAKKIADQFGDYYVLVPKGRYSISIDKKNDDATYTEVTHTPEMDVSNGIINMDLSL